MTLLTQHLTQLTPQRPRLTAIVDSVLRRLSSRAMPIDSRPLESVPRRLLVVKVHGMGDSVLIRLLIQQLLKRNPEISLGVLAGPATRELLTLGNGSQVYLYDQKQLGVRVALRTLLQIRRARYEAILNFEQGSLAGTAFVGFGGIPIHIGFFDSKNSAKSLFLTQGIEFEDWRSMWRSFVGLARIVDPGLVDESSESLEFGLMPDSNSWADEWWAGCIGARRQEVVALHLGCGSGMDFKRWPISSFVTLAEEMSSKLGAATVVLTGTALERPLIDEFISTYSGRAVDASCAGSIERTAAILRRCRLLVSVDTGVMHLGAALGVPTVGLFGPTAPQHWAPIGLRATYVYETNAACSPCVNNYLNIMPSDCVNPDKFRCMRDINCESVLAAARRVLSSAIS
jgi:heptosyltransferase II